MTIFKSNILESLLLIGLLCAIGKDHIGSYFRLILRIYRSYGRKSWNSFWDNPRISYCLGSFGPASVFAFGFKNSENISYVNILLIAVLLAPLTGFCSYLIANLVNPFCPPSFYFWILVDPFPLVIHLFLSLVFIFAFNQ